MYCTQCREELRAEAAYCTNCGYPTIADKIGNTQGNSNISKLRVPDYAPIDLTNFATGRILLLKLLAYLIYIKDFSQAREKLYRSFVFCDGFLDQHEKEYIMWRFKVSIKESSYSDLLASAYKTLDGSFEFENRIMYYSMVKIIEEKINMSHRLFFSDYPFIELLVGKAKDVKDSQSRSVYVNYYFNDCKSNFSPVGGIIKTKDDYCYFNKSKYGDLTIDDFNWVKADFENCFVEKRHREFIIEIENYLNTYFSKKYASIWEYHTKSLIEDYISNDFAWNEMLSRDILESVIGYIEAVERDFTINKQKSINEVVHYLLVIIEIILVDETTIIRTNSDCRPTWFEIAIFLVNLYCLTQTGEIIDLIEQNIIAINKEHGVLNVHINHLRQLQNEVARIRSRQDQIH